MSIRLSFDSQRKKDFDSQMGEKCMHHKSVGSHVKTIDSAKQFRQTLGILGSIVYTKPSAIVRTILPAKHELGHG